VTLRPVAGLALVLAVTPLVSAAPLATTATPTPARVQVSADEFSLALSRASIRGGPAIVELVNYGEDDHDLVLRRVGGTRTYRIGIVHPSKTAKLEARLRPGLFRLWCTLADHRGRGMSATLRVRAPST
jgi:hypothetical protein